VGAARHFTAVADVAAARSMGVADAAAAADTVADLDSAT